MKTIARTLALLSPILISAQAHAQPQAHPQEPPKSSYGIIAYSPAISVGDSHEFISRFSWAGGTLEGGWFVRPNVSLGVSGRFHYFYEKKENATYVADQNALTVTGTQFRSRYVVPAQFKTTWILPRMTSVTPVVGLGIGATHQNIYVDVGTFSFNKAGWTFSMSPEIGVILNDWGPTKFVATVRYDHAFGSNSLPANQFVSFNIGIADWF